MGAAGWHHRRLGGLGQELCTTSGTQVNGTLNVVPLQGRLEKVDLCMSFSAEAQDVAVEHEKQNVWIEPGLNWPPGRPFKASSRPVER